MIALGAGDVTDTGTLDDLMRPNAMCTRYRFSAKSAEQLTAVLKDAQAMLEMRQTVGTDVRARP